MQLWEQKVVEKARKLPGSEILSHGGTVLSTVFEVHVNGIRKRNTLRPV